MNKKIAFDNRLCYEREVLRQHAIHQTKLQTILPTCQSPSKVYLDSNEPPRQVHLSLNRKRLQLEKERQMDIFTQNQRLAAKMEHILNRQENVVLASGTPASPPPGLQSPRGPKSPKKLLMKPIHSPAYVHMPGIRLDSSQTPMVDCYLSPEFAMGRGNACKKTTLINKGVQRQKQSKIDEENRRMKDRLKAQKPYYNTKKWDSDWQHTATKFQHLHQNGTVGYLLPRTADGGSQVRERSPLVARRVKTRDGLPTLKPKTSHGMKPQGRGDRLLARQSQASSAASDTVDMLTIDHDEEYDEPEIVECESFVLLEATTRKGVEITVEELQIEMRDPASGVVQPGDRGLVVRGRWKGEVEGDCLIALDTLEKVAQEIDDLEMMIKLETVSTLTGMGNFPRLSSLLTEDELQRLLLKLVQVLNVQLLEDVPQLLITSRLIKSPSPTARDEKARPSHRPAPRPRTCPSTMPSESSCPPPEDYGFVDEAPPEMDSVRLDVSEQETQQFHQVLCKQLAALVNGRHRKRGLRLESLRYYVAQYWFEATESCFHVTLVPTAEDIDATTSVIALAASEVTAMLNQIQHNHIGAADVAWQYIIEWFAENEFC